MTKAPAGRVSSPTVRPLGARETLAPEPNALKTAHYSNDDIDNYFVGDDIAHEMTELYKQSKEWLADWDKKKDTKETVVEDDPNEAMSNAELDEFPF